MAGGILGILPQGADGGGILGNFNTLATDNRAALLGLGAGLLSGQGWGAGAQGYMQGMQQDQRTRLLQQAQAEKVQKQQALADAATKLGIDPNIARASPETFAAVAASKLVPKQQSVEQQIWNSLKPDQRQTYIENNYLRPKGDPSLMAQMQQRAQGAAALGIAPNDPAYKPYVLTGKLPGEDNKVMAGDRQMVYHAEDENLNLDNTIQTLQRAKDLNNKTYTGSGADFKGWVGTAVPGAGFVMDEDKAKATREFGQIMSMEAIKSMAATLKGATTDREMDRFVEILGDPSTPPDIRARTIDRMVMLAERKKQLNNERINQISGGTYFKSRANGGRGQPQAPQGPAQQAVQGLPSGSYNYVPGKGLVPAQ